MCLQPQTYSYMDPCGRKCTVTGPCGHCIDCLKDYQNSWKIRLSEEFAETCEGVFCTLTYDPRTAPIAFDENTGEIIETDEYVKYCESKDKRPLSLRHSDFHSWVKRGRERMSYEKGKRPNFKYFICGEYGPRTLRPHGHGFFLGITLADFTRYFADPWRKRFGFVSCSRLTISKTKSPQRVANYVSKYCAKGMFENPRVKACPDCFEKPRRSMSKGIGKRAALRLKDKILGPGFQDPFYTISESQKDFGRSLIWDVILSNDWSNNHILQYEAYTIKKTTRDLPEVGKRGVSYQVKLPIKLVETYSPRLRPDPSTGIYPTRDIRVSIPYKESFLETIRLKSKVVYEDYQNKKSFTYKLPRYFRAVIFGEGSPLSVQLQAYVSACARRDCITKLEELQSIHPDWTPLQTYREMVFQTNRERSFRAENAYKALKKFYQSSKV